MFLYVRQPAAMPVVERALQQLIRPQHQLAPASFRESKPAHTQAWMLKLCGILEFFNNELNQVRQVILAC